jgi:hypothetical protein
MKTLQGSAATGVAAQVAEHAETVRDVLRRGRSNATRGNAPQYVSNLAKAVLSRPEWRRAKCVEQLVALVLDMARRGAVNDAVQFCDELKAIAIGEHRRLQADTLPSLFQAHMREQHAQSLREEAEAALTHEQTPAAIELFLQTSTGYRTALEEMDEVVRAMREHI